LFTLHYEFFDNDQLVCDVISDFEDALLEKTKCEYTAVLSAFIVLQLLALIIIELKW